MTTALRRERGQVGGIEVLPFGLLVLVAGALIVVSAWGVVDAKFAADSAARAGARWVAESAQAETPLEAVRDGAEGAALRALDERARTHRPEVDIRAVDGTLERCGRVQVTVVLEQPAVRAPFLGALGGAVTITAHHTAVVDSLRSGVGGEATCIR